MSDENDAEDTHKDNVPEDDTTDLVEVTVRDHITGELKTAQVPSPGEEEETRKPTPFEIASEIMGECKYVTVEETDEILEYRRGVYLFGADPHIKHAVQEKMGEDCSIHMVRETLEHIRRATYRPLADFDANPCIINLRNGLLDVTTVTVTPHTPDFLSLNQLDIFYNPSCKGEAFLNFMEEILPDVDARQLTIDMIASTLWRTPNLKKGFLAFGPTDTAKSTLLRLVQRILGSRNYSNVALQDLANDRFQAAKLLGKMANIYADISDEALKQTGKFKAITGGDSITAQKKFGNPFEFIPYAKHFYSCNLIPATRDESDAFFNRWIVVIFSVQFTKKGREITLSDRRKKFVKKDSNILERLLTKDELSGILNVLLDRLKVIIPAGAIPNSPTVDQTRMMWEGHSDFVKMFINQCLVLSPQSTIERDKVYSVYTQWCDSKKITAKSRIAFNGKIDLLGALRVDTKPGGRGTASVSMWKGIALKHQSNLSSLQNKNSDPSPKKSPESTEPPEKSSVSSGSSGNFDRNRPIISNPPKSTVLSATRKPSKVIESSAENLDDDAIDLDVPDEGKSVT